MSASWGNFCPRETAKESQLQCNTYMYIEGTVHSLSVHVRKEEVILAMRAMTESLGIKDSTQDLSSKRKSLGTIFYVH